MTSLHSSPARTRCAAGSAGCSSEKSCTEAHTCLAGPTSHDHVNAVLRTLHRMRSCPGHRFSLNELAQTALLSPFYFHRVFRRVTTTTPSRFLTALRMVEAKRLLMDTSLSVTEICDAVGYASLGTFTTQFSRHVGLSPSRYRNAVLLYGEQPMSDVLTRFRRDDRPDDAPPVHGLLTGGPGAPVVAAVGLFDSGIPQGQPQVSTVVDVPGVARLFGLPDGRYHALAMCLDERASVGRSLHDAGGPTGYVGASRDVVSVRDGTAPTPFEIELRTPQAVDPPIVFAAPLLLAIAAYSQVDTA
jgi:AraC family transcriptional regulator